MSPYDRRMSLQSSTVRRPTCGHRRRSHRRRRALRFRPLLPHTNYGLLVDEDQEKARRTAEEARRIAFGRFVTRARKQWLDRDPARRMKDFGRFVGSSTATIDRWMNGDWKLDPEREKVDEFCRRLHIDPQVAYTTLGWGLDAPVRAAPEPEPDPDLDRLARKLRDPSVPASEKVHIRSMIRYLAERHPPEDLPEQNTG